MIDNRNLYIGLVQPSGAYLETNTLWLNLNNNKLMRYDGVAWLESHNHGDYYALKAHLHEINDVDGLSDKLKEIHDKIDAAGGSAIYVGYFETYSAMQAYTGWYDNCWCTVASDETHDGNKSKYIYSGGSFIYSGNIAEDSILINDLSDATNVVWSGRKLTDEFDKRPAIVISDTEPTDLKIGQIWIAQNPGT